MAFIGANLSACGATPGAMLFVADLYRAFALVLK
jgi:hypothetical protein